MIKKTHSLSLFIFRRDLRLHDNTALLHALETSTSVIPCFIFDPEQVTDKNSYKSNNALQFMLESLNDLKNELKKDNAHFYLFYGTPHTILENIYNTIKIDALFVNNDYTPYSKSRDLLLRKICQKLGVVFNTYDDLLLHSPDAIYTKTATPFTIFTPYLRAASKKAISYPIVNNFKNYYTDHIISEYSPEKLLSTYNENIFFHGGRRNGLTILKNIKEFKEYAQTRDIPAFPTTGLSAHNKFGTLSIREVYYSIKDVLGASHPLIKQLYWRDFYTQIADHFPHVFGHNFLKKYKKLAWRNNTEHFKRWCTGTTGFPIVDAGMRQLNATGWMHNRARMIVASFLTKDLLIDWRWGEFYFAKQLADYDPAVNNGNWQWAASTGCDAQPYFRIFNPWIQQKNFDPQCTYIKQWVPELFDIPPKVIHTLHKNTVSIKDYPRPIVDHAEQVAYVKNYIFKT